jgi:hypothetical protein
MSNQTTQLQLVQCVRRGGDAGSCIDDYFYNQTDKPEIMKKFNYIINRNDQKQKVFGDVEVRKRLGYDTLTPLSELTKSDLSKFSVDEMRAGYQKQWSDYRDPPSN